MKQLGVLDSAFINLEQPNTPQHIGGLGIYDPSTAPGGHVRFKQVIAIFEKRLLAMPLFRTRLVDVPGGLDRPYWVLDKNFDVEFHLRHIALPEPGDWRQLCIQVARIHARHVDMSRPLWEAYIIEGLDNVPGLPKGCFALYTKIHHSLVDGAGGQSFMAALHDLQAEPADAPASKTKPALDIVDRSPGEIELISRGLANRARNSCELARGGVGIAGELLKMGAKILRGQIPMPEILAPRSRFNGPVGPHRVFEAAVFRLDDFKAMKNAAGTKLNDVALAVIGGGMRRYLELHGELPEESLVATLPLNMRTRREATEDHNQVGSVFCSLHTDIADPLDQLKAIHASSENAKEFGEHAPLVDMLRIAGAFAPWISNSVARFYADQELSRYMPAKVSTVISNVAGPNIDLYCAGARMLRYFGIGVLTPGVGLFQLVYSAAGVLTVSVTADRDIMPDPMVYRECLERAFDDLYRALLGKRPVKRGSRSGGASRGAAGGGTRTRKPAKTRPGAPAEKPAAARRRKASPATDD